MAKHTTHISNIISNKLAKFKEVKEEHSSNIWHIFLTLLVLNFDKSKEIKEEQLQNIAIYQ